MDHFFLICALALPGLQKKCDSIWVAPTCLELAPSHRGLCNFTRDKTGFKLRIGIEPVYAMYMRRGKSLGWNASVWFAIFGMPKAFDRVEYDPAVGSTYVYCSLLSALYQHQQGALRHGLSFSMQRGVKQTDVISSFF